jgi:hypothetical protein
MPPLRFLAAALVVPMLILSALATTVVGILHFLR